MQPSDADRQGESLPCGEPVDPEVQVWGRCLFCVGAGVAGVAFRAPVVRMPPPPGRDGPRWLVSRLASGFGTLRVRWLSCWSAPPLGISVPGAPRAGRSAAGGGASVSCGGPPVFSVASIVGSSHCGWTGSAAAWLHRLPVAPPLGFGPWARVSARAGFRRGLPVPVCRQFTPPSPAWLLVSRPRDVGPPSVARRPPCLPAGCQPGRWRASGSRPGPGPGLGPGDCQMAFPWAVLPVRLVGRGAVGTPARLVPGLADGTTGPVCRLSLELGDWCSWWGGGCGGVRCRGVARAGRWCCRSL